MSGPRRFESFFEKLYISDDGSVRSDLAEPFAILLGTELATEAESALGVASGPSANGTTAEQASSPGTHTQDGKGLSKSDLVDLTGQLSNPPPPLLQLTHQDICKQDDQQPEGRAAQSPRSVLRTARSLKLHEVDALVGGYKSGKTMVQLAAEFRIERRTVSRYLRKAKVPIRRDGLSEQQAGEATQLYQAGWSAARLAGHFGVSPNTVLGALREVGVPLRPRRGGPPAKQPTS